MTLTTAASILRSDFWRFKEWRREFDGYVQSQQLPALSMVRLGQDHTGGFDTALDGVNTPETQVADNDYALGEIVSSVAHSPFADSTLIIAVEDDTWNGFDHVNAFRTAVFIAGPYVKHHAVVSMPYNTVNLVKTILEVFGAESLGINDALARPMYDIFDRSAVNWSYDAVVPDVLRSTKLPLPSTDHARVAIPKHSSQYWSKAMADQDFSGPDRLSSTFRSELWRGFKGNQPYSGAQQPRKTDGDDRR